MNAQIPAPAPSPRAPAPAPIPVVCDRCRAEGLSGADPFEAFGALLDFDPVPRRKTRPDGWDHECQRAFIAALSLTGSVRAACRAVGKSAFGAERLREAEGGESFAAAWEEAEAIAGDERSRRFAEGVRAIAAEQSGWRPPEPPWARAASRGRPPAMPLGHAASRGLARARLPAPETDPESEEAKLAWLDRLVHKYLLKVRQEREARLAGEIVAADYYVRQLTYIEVMLDLMGTDGFAVLNDFRAGDHHIIDIAETPFSRILGEVRRACWAEAGEPPRPEHPPRRYLEDHGRFSSEPNEYTRGGLPQSHDEQMQVFRERHRQDAEEQLRWEEAARRDAEARRDHESRRASVADLMDEGEHRSPAGGRARSGGGAAGQPASEGRQD